MPPVKYTENHKQFFLEHKHLKLDEVIDLFLKEFPDFELVSKKAITAYRHKIGACYQAYSNYFWTEEKVAFMQETKHLSTPEAWQEFQKRYPGQTTKVGFYNKRSRLGISPHNSKNYTGSRAPRPLYSEKMKKDYIWIKVAQPSVWWPKQKWVWVETHPERLDEMEEHDCFLFLDGNNRNFDPANIEPIHRREQVVFINEGGVVPGCPEETKVNLLRARLKLKTLDYAEKHGLVMKAGGARYIREDFLAKAREEQRKARENLTPEQLKRRRERQRGYWEKRRLDPEYMARYREYHREWSRRKREKANTIQPKKKNGSI